MATTVYCVLADVQDRLSTAGVSLRVDDNPPNPTDRNALLRASLKVNFYCQRRYDPVRLAASDWVVQTAADIAALYLCEGRGNPVPASIAQQYKEVMDELKAIQKGKADIPDIAARRVGAPVMSNVRIRLRPEPHSRAEPARSSKAVIPGPTDYVQVRDWSQWVGEYTI